jgi:hypothetical protein
MEYSNNSGFNERDALISLADVFHQLANTHSKEIKHYLNGLKNTLAEARPDGGGV